jgi:hypothetical protein
MVPAKTHKILDQHQREHGVAFSGRVWTPCCTSGLANKVSFESDHGSASLCVCSSRQDDQKTRDFSESRPLAHQAVFESHLRTVLAFLAEKFSEDL